MIFYFSATGNSKHVAQSIADAIGDRIIPIDICLKKSKFNFIAQPDEKIGFVFPVYNLGLPIVITDFIKKLNLNIKNNYVFIVATFGFASGPASRTLKNLLAEKNIYVNARYSVKMPDTWTPVYDVSDKEKIKEINRRADYRTEKIIREIKKNANHDPVPNHIPFYNAFNDLFCKDYEDMRRTETLSVNNSCSGCGKCAELCPVDAIEIQNGKPVWLKDKCAMCLGCLHRCPEFAIHRGKKTALHGQYIHP